MAPGYQCPLTPVVYGCRFSREGNEQEVTLRNWLERVVDAVFAVDLLLQFRIAYHDSHDDFLVTIPSLIAKRYLRTSFALDFVSTFPFDVVVGAFFASNNVVELRSLKLVRVLVGPLCAFMRPRKASCAHSHRGLCGC